MADFVADGSMSAANLLGDLAAILAGAVGCFLIIRHAVKVFRGIY